MANFKKPTTSSMKQNFNSSSAKKSVSKTQAQLKNSRSAQKAKMEKEALNKAKIRESKTYGKAVTSQMSVSFNFSNKPFIESIVKNIDPKKLQNTNIATTFEQQFTKILKEFGLRAAKSYVLALRKNIRNNKWSYPVHPKNVQIREAIYKQQPPHIALIRSKKYINAITIDPQKVVVTMKEGVHPDTEISYKTLAKVLEYGSHLNRAFPHWRPTMTELRPKINKEVIRQLNKLLKHHFNITLVRGENLPIATRFTN